MKNSIIRVRENEQEKRTTSNSSINLTFFTRWKDDRLPTPYRIECQGKMLLISMQSMRETELLNKKSRSPSHITSAERLLQDQENNSWKSQTSRRVVRQTKGAFKDTRLIFIISFKTAVRLETNDHMLHSRGSRRCTFPRREEIQTRRDTQVRSRPSQFKKKRKTCREELSAFT